MFSRKNRAPFKTGVSKTQALPGLPQLTLAHLMVFTEAVLRCFARPLIFALVFMVLAWLGLLVKLYPFAHLLALAVFIALFSGALGRAFRLWTMPSPSLARRRVEQASGLEHRPLDVLADRPVGMSDETQKLWQEHVAQARDAVRRLRWPRWSMKLAGHDPYHARYALIVMMVVGLVAGWGALGGRMIAAINPALGKLALNHATVDAWITPPDYTHRPPIMIATPAGNRFQDQIVNVPVGSVLHAHVAEKDGDTPVLVANGTSTEFSSEDDKDFGVTVTLNGGDNLSIQRGWLKLGSWKIRVLPDTPPQVAFSEPPAVTERKDVRIAYDAKDDYGIASVQLRVTPRESLVGISSDPIEVALASSDEREVKRVDFKDLTSEPWAGMMVDLQLIATDDAGHQAESDKVSFTLPERAFFNPVARLLIDERKKLLANILDTSTRNEAANLMAGLAQQPNSIGNDPVVMMALRAGAVRLVLDSDPQAAMSVKDILWQSATRIEDGTMGMAEQSLHQAQQELAEALDHNASEKDVQALIDRLHQALSRYLAELATRVAAHPTQAQDLGQVLGSRTNVLTPQDLDRMLDQMKSLSASGERQSAREELARLQQMMENLQTRQPQLTQEQQAALENLKALRALKQEQQALLDSTFQKAQKPEEAKADNKELAAKQKALADRAEKLTEDMKQSASLSHSTDAMQRAEKSLRQGAAGTAVTQQNEALKALQQAEQSMTENLRQSLFALPGAGSAQSDPFGRSGGTNIDRENAGSHIPDHIEAQHVRDILNEIQQRAGDMNRPKTEREYIERLLQNF